MAPIYAAAVGITPQIIDDPELETLRSNLEALEFEVAPHKDFSCPDDVDVPMDIEALISLIEPHQKWKFEEQVSAPSPISSIGSSPLKLLRLT